MKKRLTVLLIIVIISLQSASAFENIFDDYVYSQDTFQVEEDIYYVTLANDEESILLNKNDLEKFQIDNGTCEDTKYYQYCFMGLKLDYNDYGRQIPNSFNWEPAIHVQIYSKKPQVSISKTATNEINLDEKAQVTVTITNNGELRVNDLAYSEIIPLNADLVSKSSELELQGNVLSWSRTALSQGDSVTFTYQLAPTSYESIVLTNATLNYIYEELEFEETPASKTIKINTPFSISHKLDKNKAGLGETVTYTLTVKNNDWNDLMSGEFLFAAPSRIEILEVNGDDDLQPENFATFKLKPGETQTVTIKMSSEYKGTYPIYSKAMVEIRDENLTSIQKYNLTITVPELKPTLSLSKTSVAEGKPFTITAAIHNPAEVSFYGLKATLKSGLFGIENLELQSIGAGETETLYEETLNAPNVENETLYNVTLKGDYRTKQTQWLSFQEKKSLKVTPLSFSFQITKNLGRTEVKPGAEVIVTVKAKNEGDKPYTIRLEEQLPERFEVTSGLKEKTIALGVGREETFYIYKVRVPVDTPIGNYNLTTKLSTENLYEQFASAELKVMPEEQPAVEVDVPEKEEFVEPEEKKKGFIKKIIDFFVTIFK